MQNGYNVNNKALATKESEVRWRVLTGRKKKWSSSPVLLAVN